MAHPIIERIEAGRGLPARLAGGRIYPKSIHEAGDALYCMVHTPAERLLLIAGAAPAGFAGESLAVGGMPVLVCALTPENAQALMATFPFAAPSCHHGHAFTMGLGDRLGLATPGHLAAIAGEGIFPVLAQQSIRELKLTGRTYEEVLAAAVFAVFETDWRGGWGADGDHLKTAEEIRYALGCGFTMITLDCSEQIDRGVMSLSADQIDSAYAALPDALRQRYESKYLGKAVSLGGQALVITASDLREIVLTYHRAVDYTAEMYGSLIRGYSRPIDFEMSIDETLAATTPQAHFVVAGELIAGGVRITSLAPRFVGEFQKGIDYIGDAAAFERDFTLHQVIAAHYGYKLSIHSGSDKFAVFPIIGRLSGGNVHVKTAGTNWLEALRVISREDPALFRELLDFALEHLDEARAYYHIGAQTSRVRPHRELPDSTLPAYLDETDARQVLHITYGLMLQAKNANGSSRFHGRIYDLLHRCEGQYAGALERHIGRHVGLLKTPLSPMGDIPPS